MKRSPHKVFNRFLLVYLSLMLCTVLLLGAVCFSVRHLFRQESKYQFETQVNTAAKLISTDMMDLAGAARNLMLHPDIAKLSGVRYDTLSDYERTELYISCTEMLSTVSGALPYVFSMGCYSDETQITIATGQYPEDRAFLASILAQEPHGNTYSNASLVYYAQAFYLVVDSRNVADSEPMVSYIRLHDDLLVNTLSNYTSFAEYTRMGMEDGRKVLITANGSNTANAQPYRVQIYDELYLCAYHDVTAVDQMSLLLEIFMVGLMIVVIAICGVSIYAMYRSIHQPLTIMKKAMEDVRAKNWDTRIHHRAYSEFDELYDGFNRMSSEISHYITFTQEQDRLLNQSELRQLQAQINPHFLYNCFFSLSQLCKMGDTETATLLSQQLSAYYRYITRTGSLSTSLAEEYAHMNTYLQIQKIRFKDRVRFFVDQPDDKMKGLIFPKLVLQPMVENSYKYVFEQIAGDGELYVKLNWEKEELVICVTDNGTSLTDEDIRRINEGIHDRNSLDSHGLNNINRRLELFYNGNASLTAARTPQGGLSLTVRILPEGDTRND